MAAKTLLLEHQGLAVRRERSQLKLDQFSSRLREDRHARQFDGAIFAAGSYGRLEAGEKSDLDVFVVGSTATCGQLTGTRLLAAIADINDVLEFPCFDEEMRFYKIYTEKDLVENLGKPKDDTENSFTARMLLMLEGRALHGEQRYKELISRVIDNYFRDNKGKKDFRPLFLLNDLLRYWRTLCLNYEDTRSDSRRKWRKKNLNLRFSRMTTVFATVLVLLKIKPSSAQEFLPFTDMTPFERIATCLDEGPDLGATQAFSTLLDDYEWFLRLKDTRGDDLDLAYDAVEEARLRSERAASFFRQLLMHEQLEALSRYVVI